MTSYPMVMSLKPVAIQVGTSAELTVQSRYSLEGSFRVLISGSGVSAIIDNPHSNGEPVAPRRDGTLPKGPSNLESLRVRFHADKNAASGIRDFRVAGPHGVSTVGQLVVVRDLVVVESANNDTVQTAQKVSLPAAVCGAIEKTEDRDYFKFHVEAGQSLVFRVHGLRLEDRIHDLQFHLDPIITLRGPLGATLAVRDNGISGDPLLCHRFAQGGDYTLEIRDVRFNGNRDWVYCVEINDRPFASAVFPLAVHPGERTAFFPVGYQLGETKTLDWLVPRTMGNGLHDVRLPLGKGQLNAIPIVATELPLIEEGRADNDTQRTAQPISIPAVVNGRIEKEADVDVYSFPATKGEAFYFEVVSRRAGSPLDSLLQITDAKGRRLTDGDDLSEFGRTTADAAIESWTAPAGGTYFISVRDLLQRGGEAYVYCLTLAKPEPQFQLTLDTDKTELTPGTRGVVFVNAFRKNGFQGEIALSIEGLPEGVTAVCDPIAPKHRDGCIILKAAPTAKLIVGNIVVKGTAKHSAKDGSVVNLHALARPLQETYLPGGGRGHWPVAAHAVAVGAPSDLRGVKLSAQAITLKAGGSARVDVTIERAPGFTENVTLSPRFEHLGRVYGDTLPTGLQLDAKHSKTLLNGKETHGFLTFHALPNVEAMKNHAVPLMANVSINFVMKATYSSDPLLVTTLPAK